jgi:hypothetical protein
MSGDLISQKIFQVLYSLFYNPILLLYIHIPFLTTNTPQVLKELKASPNVHMPRKHFLDHFGIDPWDEALHEVLTRKPFFDLNEERKTIAYKVIFIILFC